MRTRRSRGNCRCQPWASISLGLISGDPTISEGHVLTAEQLSPREQTPGKPPAGRFLPQKWGESATEKKNNIRWENKPQSPSSLGKGGKIFHRLENIPASPTSATAPVVLEGGPMGPGTTFTRPTTFSSWRPAPAQGPLHRTGSGGDGSPRPGKGCV